VGGQERPAVRTTPEAIDLQPRFRAMLAAGDRACAMEVSSHALELRRVDGVRFAVAAFTNLSQDHLDFHPTWRPTSGQGDAVPEFAVGTPIVVWTTRGPAAGRLASRAVTVSLDGRRTGPRAITARAWAATLHGRSRWESRRRAPLRGRFNPRTPSSPWPPGSALASGSTCMADALKSVRPAPGACRRSRRPGVRLLVDYSHKPGALEKVLAAARRAGGGRVIAVFGAGGDRDRAKRPADGRDRRAPGRHGDRHVGQPALGGPEAIIEEIFTGIPAGAFHVEREVDRRRRSSARSPAAPGDVVIIAQGPRAGPEHAGGRKEPSTTSKWRAPRCGGAAVRHWSAERIAAAAGAELCAGAIATPAGPRGWSSTPARSSRATSSSGSRGAGGRRAVRRRRPALRRLGRGGDPCVGG
jgi:UDP-N-acetylmuramoyl-L-alanyl-D-glutamate--2,6-diaminopimelate ligase